MDRAEQNESSAAAASNACCAVEMYEYRGCGRPIHGAASHDKIAVCLMHSLDPGKSQAEFDAEFDAIVATADREKSVADFTGFVFLEANYAGRVFAADACFHRATFAQGANFSGAQFSQEADFSGARFAQGANFLEARFMRGANFPEARFLQDVHFGEATFAHGASFRGAIFSEEAEFIRAAFAQDARFSGATFMQGTYFIGATFAQIAGFGGATFKQYASFIGATFTQAADFGEATFMLQAEFVRATFLGPAEFRETKFRRDNELVPGPIFSLAQFSNPEETVFYKTYLGQALFYNCDLTKLTFSSVEWRRRKGSGKRMLFEEEVKLDAAADLKPQADSRDRRDFGLIAELYQQLKKNYDERKDYWTAGDFHYGELEMKRLHNQQRNRLTRALHQYLGLVAWYKYASEYGESFTRPFVFLLGILFIFTLLFPLAGLNPGGNDPQAAFTVGSQKTPSVSADVQLSYRDYSRFVDAYRGRKWFGRAAFFGNSLMTALSVAGFQKELKYEPSYPWGRALALLELLLTSTLIALFLLAIRRQFRR
jgi:uncharacterized protein YjbI with pentapeptide repeats